MADRGKWTIPTIRQFMSDYWGEEDAGQMDEALAAHDREVAAKAWDEGTQAERALVVEFMNQSANTAAALTPPNFAVAVRYGFIRSAELISIGAHLHRADELEGEG